MARRILGNGWWARFTFNGITRYGAGAYALIGGDGLSDRGNVSGREWGSGANEEKQSY